jgi:hypothetical protein
MRRHFLRVLQRAAVGKIRGDTGGAEAVIADRRGGGSYARRQLRHGLVGQHGRGVPRAGAEKKSGAVFSNARGIVIGAQGLGQRVMTGHRVQLGIPPAATA